MSNVINVDPNYPDKPDITTLQQMHDPLIQVTKVLQEGSGKNRKSVNVINGGTNLDFKGILALQDQLLDTKTFPKGGPGLYEFDVTDQASAAKVFWRVRLGGSGEDTAPATNMLRMPVTASGQPLGVPASAPHPMPVLTPAPPIPFSSDVENLGNGCTYHRAYKLLTMPSGRVVKWTPDQPWPEEATIPMQATPVGQTMFGGAPVAANPEVAELRATVAALQAGLGKAQEDAREQQRLRDQEAERARHEREVALLRESSEKQIAELREMVKAITAKPAEDPRIAILEAERRDRDRESAQQAREAVARAEADRKFDLLANELRTLSANAGKSAEPMITLLTTIMAQQTAQAQENLRLLKESGNAALTTAQQSALTPERHMAMMREMREMTENSGSSIINEKMLAVFSNMLDMVTRFNQSQGGDGAGWIDVIREAVDKVGTAATTFAQVQARKATAATAIANARSVEATAQVRVAEARARRLPAASAEPVAASVASAATKPGIEPARATLAEAMDRADGVSKTAPAAPTAPAAAADSAVEPVAPAAPAKRGKKAAPTTAPANPIKDASTEQLREVFDTTEDEAFFGPVFELIEALRTEFEKDPNAVAPDDVADYVIQARPQLLAVLKASRGKPPLALEMLAHGKFDYLFERMLPDADEAFWQETAKALAARMAAERASAPTG